MNDETIANQPTANDNDVLLVQQKQDKDVQAVKGVDADGNLKTVKPLKKNQNQFMRVDKHGDVFSNFFSNFLSQLKDPSSFSFFRVPVEQATTIPNRKKEGEEELFQKEMEKYAVTSQNNRNSISNQNSNNMENTQKTAESGTTTQYRYDPKKIDWEMMSDIGLSERELVERKMLDPLLKGYKTNELVPLVLRLGATEARMDARLSLKTNEVGDVVIAIHGIRKEPNLKYPLFGHEFTSEDKKNLLQTGNMGRVVDMIHPRSGAVIPSIVSVDRLTNEVVALAVDKIKIPEEIKGVKLDDAQKQTLSEGKPLYLEGMISKKGTAFDATVQFNADKRYVEFLFDKGVSNKQTVTEVVAAKNEEKLAPQMFRGKELSKEQYDKFKAGETVYVDGLVDKKGQTYQGYITFNQDTGKTEFAFPGQLKERAKPAEDFKTQVAVNSDGNTNEKTKKMKEPLQSSQDGPKNQVQKSMQETQKGSDDKLKVEKKRGRKI
ncbi:DUF3945 domain-containing protein [Flavobacterium sp. xlx-214]|uniref:DUF3945 domain-containing protein n=1 Tax=unclassified Flavobacterium TaxID=196869 RepID=UPI0013D48858|nr:MULTISPECIES: DUF3945 domain-containing protein [unclassified Flavobacterium]MBA5791571.1 DUF3945 domain-containing protein [Flavobacterium sp. xlx-221]QMI82820.1 DUF3945 domain-containing protein [Flavobacterium sp. xlx-214]